MFECVRKDILWGNTLTSLQGLIQHPPLPPEPILNLFPAFDIPFFFSPLLHSVSQITCLVSLAKLLTGFSMCCLFCALHCKGAFLASFFTEKFILETVTCRCAGAGMSWLRWNDENRVYKITTELPVHKPLSTCQNRSEKYQYFCHVSESSSGISWRLIFLQFLSFFWVTEAGQGKEGIPFFPDCSAKGWFAARAPHLSI